MLGTLSGHALPIVHHFDSFNNKLDASVIKELKKSKELSIIQINTIENVKYRSSYSIVLDNHSNPIWILNLPYFDDDKLNTYELKSFIIVFPGYNSFT